MPLSRTWYTDANVQIADGSTSVSSPKSVIWGLKSFMKGNIGAVTQGLWTVEGSSDGVTAALDGSDRWLNTFDATKIVGNAPGIAHSWIVLKSPVSLGPYYLCIDMTSATIQNVTIILSPTAFTGGTTLNRPTSTTESAIASNTAYHVGSAQSGKISRVVDADGNFWFLWNPNGTGAYQTCIGIQKLVDTRPSDLFPVFLFFGFNNGGRGAHLVGSGLFTEAGCKGRNFNNTVAMTNTSTLSVQFPYNTTWTTALPNAVDGKIDIFPAYLYSTQASHKGIRGRIPDVGIIGVQLPVGATMPIAAAPEQVVCGAVLLPFTAIPYVG